MDNEIKIIVTVPNSIKDIIAEALQSVIDINNINSKEINNKRYLSPKDIEIHYGIHKNLLAYWRDMNQGPPYRSLGRKIFYEKYEFEKFMEKAKIPTSGYIER